MIRVLSAAALVALILAALVASPASAGTKIVPLSAGVFHTCGLTPAHGVACWGAGGDGALGNGSFDDSSVPVGVTGLASGVQAVESGWYHTCALTTGGGVRCWGDDRFGELGDGGLDDVDVPFQVSGLSSGIAAVAAGGFHTCALTDAGGVTCWGDNRWGQLGDGTRTNRPAPVAVSGLSSGVASIRAGNRHTCAVMTGGGVKCWGDNLYGQLGDGTTTERHAPVDVTGLTGGATAITAGEGYTCAVTTSGGIKCWGDNGWGALGDGTFEDSSVPVDVTGLTSGATAVSSHGIHTCALTTRGGVKCWGFNQRGELGDGTTNSDGRPVDVTGLSSGIVAIAAGYYHSCALAATGEAKCWGWNNHGQLGDGSMTESHAPVDVIGPFATDLTRPLNDDFANAVTLPDAIATVTVHLFDATRETDEPPSCEGRGSVWYRWTPNVNGFALIEAGTCIDVYTGGTLATLTPVPSELPPAYQGPTLAAFAAKAGTVYSIAIAGDAASADATATVFRKFTPSPSNDDFDHAQVLVGTVGSVSGSIDGATHEVGEPGDCTALLSGSVWYEWTAPDAGLLNLHVPNDACVAVFMGSDFSSLSGVATVRSYSRGGVTDTQYRVVAGVTYHFKVATFFYPTFNVGRAFTADESVQVLAGPGGGATTDDEGDGAWPDDPIEITVTTPNAGTVSIKETQSYFITSLGDIFADIDLGLVATIAAPPANVEEPLRITFTMDASVMPRTASYSYGIYRNGQRLGVCTNAPAASPDPCLLSRSIVGDDQIYVVLTSHASEWTFTFEAGLSIEHVIVNDDGGTKTCADFGFIVGGYVGRADHDCHTTLSLPSGTYTVSQPAVAGYITTYSNCSGITLTTATVGTCTIIDNDQPAGYAFGGFVGPVDNPPVLNTVKAGQAVPVKFSIGGAFGLGIFAFGYPTSQQVTCSTSAPVDAVEETVTAGGSSLSYDAVTDQYTYVWKTDKAWSQTCRQLIVRLADGNDHVALFKFK